MGGYSYDRDVYSSSSYSNWGASSTSTEKLSSVVLDPSMLPNGKKIKSTSQNPIIIVLDVTGSNINFAKLIYDKFPMFYGEIEKQGYLKDFDVCICAVGDYLKGDKYPLQIGQFAKGIEIDSWLEKIVLEGGGGSNLCESYQLAAHYLINNTEFDKYAEPIVFFIGDEMPYDVVCEQEANAIGIPLQKEYNPFPILNMKFNNKVYMMLNKYCGRSFTDGITDIWKEQMPPQHLIEIPEEKEIVDLILGVIATEAQIDLGKYSIDMKNRGQTPERIASVTSALKELSTSLAVKDFDDIATTISPMTRKITSTKGTRIG